MGEKCDGSGSSGTALKAVQLEPKGSPKGGCGDRNKVGGLILPEIRKFFDNCIKILEQRSEEFGDFKENLIDVASESKFIFGYLPPEDVALILASLKWVRIKSTRGTPAGDDTDSYYDLCNYVAAALVLKERKV